MPYYTTFNFSAPEATYLANLKGPTDEGWYLNSGETHHLINNIANMSVTEEFSRSYQLIIQNRQGFSITYIDNAFHSFKSLSVKHKAHIFHLKTFYLYFSLPKIY